MRKFLLLSLALVLAACAAAPTAGTSAGIPRPVQSRTSQELTRQSIASQEELTPYTDMMVYPANWTEITRMRQ